MTQKKQQAGNESKTVNLPDKLTVKDIQIGAGPECSIGQKVGMNHLIINVMDQ
jgi:FKBP-type peptidyl-prolyl cis-trans isomerase